MGQSLEEKWEWQIKPQTSWLGGSLKEVAGYKDLLFRLVRKEFLTSYQQTLLGPLWILINPLLTVLTYNLIFNKVIGVSTEGVPSFAYYLTGITLWNLFSDILSGTSNTFAENAHVFSKVYFPRIIAPLSIALLHCMRFFIQFLFVIVVVSYYCFAGRIDINISRCLLSIPVIAVTAGCAFGGGLILSILTAKYRDLTNIIGVVMRLLLFVSPVFYSQSIVPDRMKWLIGLNPLSSLFELFRFSILGKGYLSFEEMLYTLLVTVFAVFSGVLLFNKFGDKLMDVI